MGNLAELLHDTVPDEHLLVGDAISDDYGHDEALTVTATRPGALVRPGGGGAAGQRGWVCVVGLARDRADATAGPGAAAAALP